MSVDVALAHGLRGTVCPVSGCDAFVETRVGASYIAFDYRSERGGSASDVNECRARYAETSARHADLHCALRTLRAQVRF